MHDIVVEFCLQVKMTFIFISNRLDHMVRLMLTIGLTQDEEKNENFSSNYLFHFSGDQELKGSAYHL